MNPVNCARVTVSLLPSSRKGLLVALASVIAIAAVAHMAATLVEFASGDPDIFTRFHLGEIRREFDLESESNVTTWLSSAMLLFCALLLSAIGRARRRAGDALAGYWLLLAVVFLFASIEETAMLHEATMRPLAARLHPSGVFFYAWVVLGLPIAIILGIVNLRFLQRLPRRTRLAFIVAGAVYLGGALGLEMGEGVIATQIGAGSFAMFAARWLEEVMEMCGVLLFMAALLRYIAEELPPEPLVQDYRRGLR